MNVWYFVLIPIAVLIGGFILIYFFFMIGSKLKDILLFRKIPKDKKEVSVYIKQNKEFFADGGKVSINEMEVKQQDERDRKRFREFEKLRQYDREQRRNNKQPAGNNRSSSGNEQVKGQGILSPEDDDRFKQQQRNTEEDKREFNGSGDTAREQPKKPAGNNNKFKIVEW